jgi:hypothetical protein
MPVVSDQLTSCGAMAPIEKIEQATHGIDKTVDICLENSHSPFFVIVIHYLRHPGVVGRVSGPR